MSSADLSVVVPIYNGAHVLAETVPAMMAQGPPAEWVFVDDGSTDGSVEVLEALLRAHPPGADGDARIVRLLTNSGRAAAREAGVEAAAHATLLFLDCDVAPEPGYITAITDALRRPGAVAAVGRVVVACPDPHDPYHRYLDGPRRGAQGAPAGRPLPWRYFLLGVSGVAREAYEAAGGLHGAVAYGEDLELGARLGRLFPEGLRYAPGAVGRIYDVGTLDTALARMEEFGRASARQLAASYPELEPALKLPIIGPDGPAVRRALARAVFSPPLGWAARWLLPLAPPPLQRMAVRYLLAQALARGYRHAPLP